MAYGESDTRAKLIDPRSDTPEVTRAGGLSALKTLGQPADILRQTKERLFAA